MKKLFLCLILSTTCSLLAVAQKNNVDSLQKAYNKNRQDTTLIKLFLEKSLRVFLLTNPDSGVRYAQKSLLLSRKIHYQNGEVRSLAGIAVFQERGGDLPGALKTTFNVLPQAIQIKNYLVQVQCYNTLGLVYSVLKDYKKATYYFFMSKNITEVHNINDLAMTEYNNISRNYLDTHRLDSALFFTQKAYDLSIKKHLLKNIGYLIRNFGIIQYQKGNDVRAIAYYKESIDSIPGHDNHYLLSEDYRRMAEAFLHMKAIDSSIYYLKKAFDEAVKNRSPELEMRSTALLTNVFKLKGDFKEAFNYQQVMIKAQDSLFSQQKTLQVQNLTFNEEQRRQQIAAVEAAYQNRVRQYTLVAILGVFILIASILLFANQKRKKANSLLRQRNEQIETQHKALEKTLAELKTTQTQLIQSEKMASLGELTAGIAHEIQNPLNFVNNFSEVNTELIDEMQQEIDKGNFDEVKTIAVDVKENQQKISQHGKRADFIVKGMLQHSRTNSGEKQLTNMNVLADEFLRLAYHGLRAKDKSFNAELTTNFDPNLPKINVVQQDMGRVMLNLFNNALYAVNQKAKTAEKDYKPEVTVTTSAENGKVVIKVKDNGTGISDAVKEKIMQPFFTTKPTGEGTGLGLSLTYDMVVKGHGGNIQVNSVEDEGSEFIIQLPIN
jgi:two-component system NtrC family sensor kinase